MSALRDLGRMIRARLWRPFFQYGETVRLTGYPWNGTVATVEGGRGHVYIVRFEGSSYTAIVSSWHLEAL